MVPNMYIFMVILYFSFLWFSVSYRLFLYFIFAVIKAFLIQNMIMKKRNHIEIKTKRESLGNIALVRRAIEKIC